MLGHKFMGFGRPIKFNEADCKNIEKHHVKSDGLSGGVGQLEGALPVRPPSARNGQEYDYIPCLCRYREQRNAQPTHIIKRDCHYE